MRVIDIKEVLSVSGGGFDNNRGGCDFTDQAAMWGSDFYRGGSGGGYDPFDMEFGTKKGGKPPVPKRDPEIETLEAIRRALPSGTGEVECVVGNKNTKSGEVEWECHVKVKIEVNKQ